MPHILLVDDEPAQRQAIRKALELEDMKVSEAASVMEAEDRFELGDFDLVITEIKLPGEPGSELIRMANPIPVIVMTNYASLRTAVDSMKMGAVDYLAKPCAPADLLAVVREALQDHPQSHNPRKSDQNRNSDFFEGTCPKLRHLREKVVKIAQTDSTVLILGETGTGKELTARQVHQTSARSDRRMIAVNCAAIPESLIESELFGYEKGAFTGANSNRVGLIEAADGGTLFLDEIGELPLSAQARLLRFIQEGEIRRIGSVTSRRVDVRLICATHRELAELSSRNEFRQDLYYRINVLRLEIPPLRERGADVRDMAEWFAETLARRMERPVRQLSLGALDAVARYQWPGNVRELEHAIERGVVMADGEEITTADLGLPNHRAAVRPIRPIQASDHPAKHHGSPPPQATKTTEATDAVDTEGELSLEDYFMRFVLEHQDAMNETELAHKLGISRKCLWERRQRFNLPRKKTNKNR